MEVRLRLQADRTRPHRRRLITLTILMMAAVSLACGGPAVAWVDRMGMSAANEPVYPPSSMRQLAGAVDLVLRGTVVEIVDDGIKLFATAEPTPEGEDVWVDEDSMPWFREQSAPMIRVDVRVDELVFARASVPLPPGSVVSISFWGELSDNAVPSPAPWYKRDWPEVWRLMRVVDVLPRLGDERLFLLWDQDWSPVVTDYYGMASGAYSILDLSGPQVMLNSSPPIRIDITENTAPEAFLEELKAVLREH